MDIRPILRGMFCVAFSVVFSGSAAFGQYVWDYAANPAARDTNRWHDNGASYSIGISFPGAAPGASVISGPAIPVADPATNLAEPNTSSADYEIQTPLNLNGAAGATFIHFLRASSQTVISGSGSYISVELSFPTNFVSPGWATLNINQSVNGTITNLGQTYAGVNGSATLRSVIFSGNLWVFLNNYMIWSGNVPQTTGNPGLGGYNQSGQSGFSAVYLGHHDVIGPNAVSGSSVATSVFPTSVSMRWQPVTDDARGVGVWAYAVFRNGTWMQSVVSNDFTDNTVQASTAYTYAVQPCDFHGNCSGWTQFTVTTPPAGAIDPRRTGVSTTGAYWGGAGEQIDALSGNLNFSIPLLQAQGRSGWAVPLGLAYNSQNWRNDNGTYWKLGNDVGYGYGWQMQFGSLTPYYVNWWSAPDHYVYTDATGAQYMLNLNNNGVWSSSRSLYVWFDANADVLHFRDGSFWVMGAVSGGTEQDAGSLYPTTMQDSNGNQVLVTYQTGAQSPVIGNSSARIATIEDDRAQGNPRATYSFSYTFNQAGDPFPHLHSISNTISTPESYLFQTSSYALNAPFSPTQSFGSSYELSTVIHTTVNTTDSFLYDTAGAGELVQANLPDGGIMSWQYTNFSYSGNRVLREVGTRQSQASSGAPALSYTFSHNDAGNPNPTVHASAAVQDQSGSSKNWTFITTNTTGAQPWQIGLLSKYQDVASGGTALRAQTYTWTTDTGTASGKPYISQTLTQYNPGASYEADTTSTQTLDLYGNATQQKLYDFGNASTPIRTWTNTYLHTNNSTYDNAYIRNRLVSTSVTDQNNNTTTLATNTYDSGTPASISSTIYEFDATNAGRGNTRGNVTRTVSPGSTVNITYDATGHALTGANSTGTGGGATYSATTNYAAPDVMTPQAGTADVSNSHSVSQASGSQLASSYGYTTALALANAVMPNSASTSQTFSSSTGLLASSVSVHGATTNYSYTFNPTVVTATTNAHWSKDYRDGFGRSIASESGYGTTVVSHTDAVYGAAAALPFGQVVQTSQPYGINGSQRITTDGTGNVAWATVSYDGLGRSLTSTAPDGSVTQYVYQGNTTKVIDPAGNWKRYTTDALGNLVQVTEPNPQYGQADNNSTNFQTYYSYDREGHLTQVQMPRSGTTQTRTFNYNLSTGLLTSVTNPENGTVSYSYYPSGRLLSKTDGKNHKVVYSYDGYGRLAYIDRYNAVTDTYPDPCQSVALTYDSGSNSPNAMGRVASGTWGWTADQTYCGGQSVTESYAYTPGGLVTGKGWNVYQGLQTVPDGGTTIYYEPYYAAVAQENFSYDNEGHMTAYGPFSYTLDQMGRPTTLTENVSPAVTWVQNAAYGPGGELDSMQYRTSSGAYYTENRAYNNRSQLTSLQANASGLAGINLQYGYPAPPGNAGRISRATNVASGDQVAYIYDSLNRLIQAQTTSNSWGQGFTFDGFGNLIAKTVTAGSAPYMSLTVDPTTNHIATAGFQYDGNGNLTNLPNVSGTLSYDIENRTGSGNVLDYDLENQPLVRDGQWNLYGLHGERLATYTFNGPSWSYCTPPGVNQNYCSPGYTPAWATVTTTQTSRNIYFAGRLIQSNNKTVLRDRLASVRGDETGQTFGFYPFGEEIGTGTTNGREKFSTYTRESSTGLDYANQRYYASTYGRFLTADPYAASGGPSDPGSWNRYSYVRGDPVNRIDPRGLYDYSPEPYEPDFYTEADFGGIGGSCGPDWMIDTSLRGPCCDGEMLCDQGGGVGGGDAGGPAPSCNITVATSGPPQFLQNFDGVANTPPPPGNMLGAYYVGDNPNLLLDGWFFAVQVQGMLMGDTNPADWTAGQTVNCSGSLRLAGGGTAKFVCPNPDNPLAGAIARNADTGQFDWVDAPGPHQYIPNNGGMIVGGSITMNFVSQLTDGAVGCAVDWSVVFNIPSLGRLRYSPKPTKPIRGPKPKPRKALF